MIKKNEITGEKTLNRRTAPKRSFKKRHSEEGAKDILITFWATVMFSGLAAVIGMFVLMVTVDKGMKFQNALGTYTPIALGSVVLCIVLATFFSARKVYAKSGTRTVVRGVIYVLTTGGSIGLMIAWVAGWLAKHPYAPGIILALLAFLVISIIGGIE